MLIDTHCHLDYKSLYSDLDGVLARAKSAGVSNMITIGCTIDSWDKTLELSSKYSHIYSALALHPHDASHWNEDVKKQLISKLKSSDKIKALGEIGLDYFYLDKNRDLEEQKNLQKKVFIDQLNIAKDYGFPVIVHTRDAWGDTLEILKQYRGHRIVVHCFSGDTVIANKLIELGFYLSFTGIVTFDKSGSLKGVLQSIPMDRIMIETDSPYLAPVPKRGKTNEPSYVKYIFDYLLEVLNVDEDNLSSTLFNTSSEFFDIDFSTR